MEPSTELMIKFDYIFEFLDTYTDRFFGVDFRSSFSFSSLFFLASSYLFSVTFLVHNLVTFSRSEAFHSFLKLPLDLFRSNAVGFESISRPNDPLRNEPKQNNSHEEWRHYDPWWGWNGDDGWSPFSLLQHLQLVRFLERKSAYAYQYLKPDGSFYNNCSIEVHLSPQKDLPFRRNSTNELKLDCDRQIFTGWKFRSEWKANNFVYQSYTKVEHAHCCSRSEK